MRYLAKFTPVSGLVFRDARPFDAGTDTVSSNLDFPPPPEAFWSALNRTLVGVSPRGLRLRAFYLEDDHGPLLPAMADLTGIRPADDPTASERLSLLRPRPNRAGASSGGLNLVWLADRDVRSRPCEGEFLRPERFLSYLLGAPGGVGPGALTRTSDLIREDARTAVQLSGRNAAEGMLYTAQVVFLDRARDVHFRMVFDLRDELRADFPREHIVRLGGEGKLAHLSIRPLDQLADGVLPERARGQVFQAILANSEAQPQFRVKLCLLTPAVFSARKELLQRPDTQTPAWRPFWMDNSQGGWCRPIFDKQSYRLRLVAAVAPKAFALGAWDRARQAPRPLHRCQPAGTVYFLELKPADGVEPQVALEQFFNDYWMGTLLVKVKPANAALTRTDRTSQSVSPHGLRGFGWTVIGAWNYA